MRPPNLAKLFEVSEATWPAARCETKGCFVIRDGKGGGKRVSAATLCDEFSASDISIAATAMRALGQNPIFMVRPDEARFEQTLNERGYLKVEPTNLYLAQASDLARDDIPRTSAIPVTEPLQIMKEIWANGGIGPERLDVMTRACAPKTGIISRHNDKPAGAAFLAMCDQVTMLHALEILPEMRRQGIARWAMHRAGAWTLRQGGTWVAVACTQENDAANGLYLSLGMRLMGTYHYRIHPE